MQGMEKVENLVTYYPCRVFCLVTLGLLGPKTGQRWWRINTRTRSVNLRDPESKEYRFFFIISFSLTYR